MAIEPTYCVGVSDWVGSAFCSCEGVDSTGGFACSLLDSGWDSAGGGGAGCQSSPRYTSILASRSAISRCTSLLWTSTS